MLRRQVPALSLFESNRKLAFHISNRYVRSRRLFGEIADDIHSAALRGLFHAARRYDPSTGVMFSTYATHVIWGEIKHVFRERHFFGRKGETLDRPSSIELSDLPPIRDFRHEDERDELNALMRCLTPLEKEVVIEWSKGRTFKDIGESMGYTKQYAQLVKDRAIEKMQKRAKVLK